MVEESEHLEAENVLDYARELESVMGKNPDWRFARQDEAGGKRQYYGSFLKNEFRYCIYYSG